jgi:hypothetical protein
MAYDATLADRLRKAPSDFSGVTERRMFGGLAFMLEGHLCCGVVGDEAVVRVGPEEYSSALARPHARQMNFTGKPLKGFVYVGPQGVETDGDLRAWIGRAMQFVRSLPPQ